MPAHLKAKQIKWELSKEIPDVYIVVFNFRPKNPHVGQIDCHSLDGAPARPMNVDRIAEENRFSLPFEEESNVSHLLTNLNFPLLFVFVSNFNQSLPILG